MLHRTRYLLVRQRTALVNALWAHLAEYGIFVGKDRGKLTAPTKLLQAEQQKCLLT
ncbi:transposase [Polymorphobacter fuscus]|nr:transposase [Polymorphobacter fuscus]